MSPLDDERVFYDRTNSLMRAASMSILLSVNIIYSNIKKKTIFCVEDYHDA